MPAGKILILGGPVVEYHSIDEIAPPLMELVASVDGEPVLSQDCNELLEENIKSYDGILICASGYKLTPEQEMGLLNGIKGFDGEERGRGLFALHGAALSFDNSPAYQRMIGARFLSHPAMAKIDVKISDLDHSVLDGIKDFTIKDEFYLLEYYPPFIEILHGLYDGFKLPLAWIKPYGLGRIFSLMLGHGERQLNHPVLRQVIKNALQWSFKFRENFRL